MKPDRSARDVGRHDQDEDGEQAPIQGRVIA